MTTITKSLQKFPRLKLNKTRLLDTIHATAAQFGAKHRWGDHPTETGVCRLALSDEDKLIRDWFRDETEALGCHVKVDELGNMFATYPGRFDGSPTAIGSHLDTQPTGGRYDGILGVLSGLQVLRTFKENNYIPQYPVCVVNWTNEEGARFPVSMMASSVWAGEKTKEWTYALKSVTDDIPKTVEQELGRIGYRGTQPCNWKAMPLAGHFELHIEQGPILEDQQKRIGLVTGIQAFRWLEVTVTGKGQHTGTTPFRTRSDAMLATAKIIVRGDEIAHHYGGLCSVGVLNLEPAVVNVIPQQVMFIVDMRHKQDSGLSKMYSDFMNEITAILKNSGRNLSYTVRELTDQPAVHFDPVARQCIRDAADAVVGPAQSLEIVSGAGHDSGPVSHRCPTAMIFVPSRDGISHNPSEYTSPEHVFDGFEVLLNTILRYDMQRSA